MEAAYWKKCSTCKKPIALNAKYYVCSVSTCNGLRTGYVFCSVNCFESHLPGARHRDAWAVEKIAGAAPEHTPDTLGAAVSSAVTPVSREPKRFIANQTSVATSAPARASSPQEVLIIASRLKEYITAVSEMNTSAGVMDVLSDHVRMMCDRAIDNARADGRKTVMERDFQFLKNLKSN